MIAQRNSLEQFSTELNMRRASPTRPIRFSSRCSRSITNVDAQQKQMMSLTVPFYTNLKGTRKTIFTMEYFCVTWINFALQILRARVSSFLFHVSTLKLVLFLMT